MKYLLPELHVQLNSANDDLADAAEEAIDLASEQYNRHWEAIKPHLPASVVRFYDEQFLHDADIFGPARLPGTGGLSGGEVVIIAQQINSLNADYLNTLAFLYYTITEEPRVEIPVPSDAFHRGQPHWIWDEFDIVEPGVFAHSILYSDGRVVTIRFRDFRYEIAPLIAPDVFKTLPAVPADKAAPA